MRNQKRKKVIWKIRKTIKRLYTVPKFITSKNMHKDKIR
jgi:hypothetical protein